MAELADALDSGSSESNFMQVQVLFPAPNAYNPNQIFQIGNGFGFFLTFHYDYFLKRQTEEGFFQAPNEIIRHNEKIPPESYN